MRRDPRSKVAAQRLAQAADESCRAIAMLIVVAGGLVWLAPSAQTGGLAILAWLGLALAVLAVGHTVAQLLGPRREA